MGQVVRDDFLRLLNVALSARESAKPLSRSVDWLVAVV